MVSNMAFTAKAIQKARVKRDTKKGPLMRFAQNIPALPAGPKNSIGKGKKGSTKSSVIVPHNSNKKATMTITKVAKASIVKTGIPKLAKRPSTGRPKGKVRASNNPNLKSVRG